MVEGRLHEGPFLHRRHPVPMQERDDLLLCGQLVRKNRDKRAHTGGFEEPDDNPSPHRNAIFEPQPLGRPPERVADPLREAAGEIPQRCDHEDRKVKGGVPKQGQNCVLETLFHKAIPVTEGHKCLQLSSLPF